MPGKPESAHPREEIKSEHNSFHYQFSTRTRFVDYFDFLCSDMASFPVARAVAASSGAPVLFEPVVVQNFQHCRSEIQEWQTEMEEQLKEQPELNQTLEGLRSYAEEDTRKYAHFVDGGITDNLGLRAICDIVELAGGGA